MNELPNEAEDKQESNQPVQEQQSVKNQVFNTSSRKLLAGIVIALGVVIAIGAGAAFYAYQKNGGIGGGEQACTLEAKICPDGSTVGRTGPNCEFVECPGTDSTTAQAVDTSDWKTYRNLEYGFEFRYPSEWKIREETIDAGGAVQIEAKDFEDMPDDNKPIGRALLVGVADLTEYGVPTDIVHLDKEKISNYRQGLISGTPYRISAHTNEETRYVYGIEFYKESTLYEFEFFFGLILQNVEISESVKQRYSNDKEKFIILQDRILSTLKFIDLTDTSDWQTYRNGEYGFEVKYPTEYVMKEAREGIRLFAIDNFNHKYVSGGILPPDGAEITITRRDRPVLLQDLIYQENRGKIEDRTFAGFPAKKISYVRFVSPAILYYHVRIYLPRNDDLFTLSLVYNGSDFDAVPSFQFDVFLSTFKFIEPPLPVEAADTSAAKVEGSDDTYLFDIGDTLRTGKVLIKLERIVSICLPESEQINCAFSAEISSNDVSFQPADY